MKSLITLISVLLLAGCGDKTPTDPKVQDATSGVRTARIDAFGAEVRLYFKEVCIDGITYFVSDAGDDHWRWVIGGAKVDDEGKPKTCR